MDNLDEASHRTMMLLVTVLVFGAASILALISTGALMSIKDTVPPAVLRIYQIAPFAAGAAAVVTMHLFIITPYQRPM